METTLATGDDPDPDLDGEEFLERPPRTNFVRRVVPVNIMATDLATTRDRDAADVKRWCADAGYEVTFQRVKVTAGDHARGAALCAVARTLWKRQIRVEEEEGIQTLVVGASAFESRPTAMSTFGCLCARPKIGAGPTCTWLVRAAMSGLQGKFKGPDRAPLKKRLGKKGMRRTDYAQAKLATLSQSVRYYEDACDVRICVALDLNHLDREASLLVMLDSEYNYGCCDGYRHVKTAWETILKRPVVAGRGVKADATTEDVVIAFEINNRVGAMMAWTAARVGRIEPKVRTIGLCPGELYVEISEVVCCDQQEHGQCVGLHTPPKRRHKARYGRVDRTLGVAGRRRRTPRPCRNLHAVINSDYSQELLDHLHGDADPPWCFSSMATAVWDTLVYPARRLARSYTCATEKGLCERLVRFPN
ncbi:Dhx36 [Symbiodinium sp. CCMP2592]|nr:Dhx36 [Symbiodinium sp. CCMP2592]